MATGSAPSTSRSNGLAVRDGSAPAQPSAALAIRAGQAMWDERQTAALVAMGVPASASKAELATFLHQCQRSGLDPFSRQIYLIYRASNENGKFVQKPTVQTGIDGYRLIRDRIAKRDGLRVEYDDTVWYTADGQALNVWLWDEAPAACTVAIRIDGRRYSSTLRFNEYAQRKKDGSLNKMWSEKPAHMIEKCAEADVLRRAFPQDLSGLLLEDAAPSPADAPAAPPQRPDAARIRQEAAKKRQRPVQAKAEPVDAEVVAAAAASDPVEWPEWATEGHLNQAKRLDIGPDTLARAMGTLAQGDPEKLTEVLSEYTVAEALLAAIDGQGAGEDA